MLTREEGSGRRKRNAVIKKAAAKHNLSPIKKGNAFKQGINLKWGH